MAKTALFTIDWEPYFSYKPYGPFWEATDAQIEEPTKYLLDLLRRHDIKAIFYVVGWLRDRHPLMFEMIKLAGHTIGDHTYYHSIKFGGLKRDIPYYETPDGYTQKGSEDDLFRTPKFKNQKKFYSGGFWLRLMPYWWLKREVEKEGVFFAHPHDLMLSHPKCKNPIRNWQRQLGLKTSRDKLERLCREIKWNDPNG